LKQLGRLVASHREHVASDVAKCEVTTKRAPDGSVDRESVGSASGFPFGSLPSAVGSRRRSSFPARARPALGFRLSQVSRVRPLLQRARADGAEWSVAFHRSPGRGSPAAESAHGFASDASRPRDEFGKQYQSRRSPSVRRACVDRSLSRDATLVRLGNVR
jgi:hypothetical protein